MKDRKAVLRFGSRSASLLPDLIQLVRAPAALSVPGDVLVGAAATGSPVGIRTLGAMGSSVCLYWAGMALNDYADAAVDAVERPQRPIPSGRVPRRTALGVACGLTAAGLGLAFTAAGRRGLVRALPLAGVVWAYDLKLKSTPAGPVAMASARALDVLMGALPVGDRRLWRQAAVPAALIGAHTYTVTELSRREVTGATAGLPATTLAASAATAIAVAAPPVRTAARLLRQADGTPATRRFRRAFLHAGVAVAATLSYAATYGTAQVRAVRKPSGANVQRAVGAGILSLMPLQAALTARAGAPAAAAVLGVGHPLARRLARRISPT
ncbi:SCO3242 family prenyltransferase [Streptomyces sp. NPDC001795]|uniref:SCO3242 family prenyltransferase n=1 Tax=unclassified Streptomyces TaxID=2593676 RepID=UPI00332FE048